MTWAGGDTAQGTEGAHPKEGAAFHGWHAVQDRWGCCSYWAWGAVEGGPFGKPLTDAVFGLRVLVFVLWIGINSWRRVQRGDGA